MILVGSLSMQRFWATDSNRKCAAFVFNLSSHFHINVAKSVFTSRYDQFENLRETTVLACEMFTSGWSPWLKNVACLRSLLLTNTTDIIRGAHKGKFICLPSSVSQVVPQTAYYLMWIFVPRVFRLGGFMKDPGKEVSRCANGR